MTVFQAIIIAIVEGLTEFLPVSSTGHMIITESILGVPHSEFVKAFTVIIQFGAILSVVALYWRRFLQSWDFYYKLLIAFIPAAILGVLFSKKIDQLLESVEVVAIMLIIGGIIMLFVDKWFNKPTKAEGAKVSTKDAFIIGCFQCIAMIPGVSRSMATIVGGMVRGFTRKDAAEFSFFLAVPTMAAATLKKVYDLVKVPGGGHFDFDFSMLKANMNLLIIGNVVAFLVAMLAIKFFIGFVTKNGFKAFGIYRIIVGSIILLLLLFGHQLTVA